MNVVLDTNVLIHILTGSATGKAIAQRMEHQTPFLIISIVSKAELISIATQRKWGKRKMVSLQKLLDEFLVVPIDNEELVATYAEIDAFSQGKLDGKPLGMSARNMGKNDLWIAATAHLAKAPLMTCDRDFDHLNGRYLTVDLVE